MTNLIAVAIPPPSIDWLGVLKSDYVEGRVALERFEHEVDAYLREGTLPARLSEVSLADTEPQIEFFYA